LRYSGFAKRIIPEARLDWRFPFINKNAKSNTHQVFEPIVSAIVSPYGSNPNTIPNEDSKDFVFNTTNLFSNNRFTGLDRVESGPRVNYGVRWGVFGKSSGQTTVTIGQSYRLKRDDTFSENSGLEDNFSDVVAQVLTSPQKYIGLLYRTRLSKDNLEPRETEVNATIGNRSFSFASTYTFLDQSANTQFFDREEVTFSASSQITKNWRASFSSRRDLKAKQVRSLAGSVAYENECCVLSVNASRTFFEDRDLKPTDSVFIRLILKTIGEVQNVNL
jgi:LPS-assembly protein